MLQENPGVLAAELQEKTGIKVLAATDGLVVRPDQDLF